MNDNPASQPEPAPADQQCCRPGRTSPRSRSFLIRLGILVGFALALRLLVGFALADHDPDVINPRNGSDMAAYHRFASQLIAGDYKPSQTGYYYQPFYYSGFLSTIYRLFGTGANAVIVFQALLAAATIWLTGILFARIGGRRAGLLAALLLGLARMHIAYTPYRLMAVLQTFWIIAICYGALAAWRRRTITPWFLVGIVTGFAIVTRGNMQLFTPLLLVLCLWRFRGQIRKQAMVCGVVLIGTVLPQLPYSIANLRATGKWVGPSTAAGSVLGLGNNPQSPRAGIIYTETYLHWSQLHDATGPERVPMTTSMRNWIVTEPLVWLELKLRTAMLFFDAGEISNNLDLERLRDEPLLDLPLLLGFGIIGTLGCLGFLLCGWQRRQPIVLFMCATVFLYIASITIFYYLGRYRIPLLPLFCGFGALALDRLWRNRQDGRSVFKTVALAAGCAVLVFGATPWYRQYCEATIFSWIRPEGLTVRIPGKVLITDNGPPGSQGGWTAAAVRPPATIEKTLVVAPDLELADATLRFQVISTGKLYLQIGSNPPMMTSGGTVDLSIPLASLDYDRNGDQLSIRVQLQASSEFGILLDHQRQYGRTKLNGSPTSGEWVATMHVPVSTTQAFAPSE